MMFTALFSLKRLNLLVFIALGLGIFAGCSSQYGPPMLGKQNFYMAKPSYDTTNHNVNSYGGLELTSNSGYNNNETNVSLMPSYHRAHAFSFYDVAYGTFGYIGRYGVSNIPENNGGKLFYGAGARASANFNWRINNFNWRVIGIEGAYSKEFGAYRQLRDDFDQSNNDSLLMFHTQGNSAEFGLFTEFLFNEQGNEDYFSFKAGGGVHPNFGQNNLAKAEDPNNNAVYFQVLTAARKGPVVITGNYFLSTGFSSSPLLRNGLALGLQFSLSDVLDKEQQQKLFK